MKNNLRFLLILLSFQPLFGFGQSDKPVRIKTDIFTVVTDIFTVVYSEVYEQPLQINYKVLCPMGDASREGLDFRKFKGIHTSDKYDYIDNPYDKGHMALCNV